MIAQRERGSFESHLEKHAASAPLTPSPIYISALYFLRSRLETPQLFVAATRMREREKERERELASDAHSTSADAADYEMRARVN